MRKVTENHLIVTGLLFFCFIALFMVLPAWAAEESTIVYGLNTQYVVWHDNTTTDGNNDIFFKKSADGGVTWEEPYQNISNNAGDSQLPSMAVNGSNLYVVWHDNTPGNYEIFFIKSTDGGNTWEPYQNLSNNAGNSMTWGIAIAVDGLNLYVVWEDHTLGNAEIFFIKSTDSGNTNTWESYQNISNNAGDSCRASMAVDGLNIYVVWQDDAYDPIKNPEGDLEAFFRRSTDGGVTWDPDLAEPAENLSNNGDTTMCPVIAIDGPNLYVVMGNSGEILFRRSTDGGVTWEPYQNISNNSGHSAEPFIAVAGSNIYAIWEDNTGAPPPQYPKEIFFRLSRDGGNTWEPYQNLSNNAGDSRFPSIAVYGVDIYVAWYDDTLDPGYPEIFFRRSTDGGVTWDPYQNISNNTGDSLRPKIAVDAPNNQYVVWADSGEILFRRSIDGGVTWEPYQNLSNNTGDSYKPSIAVYGLNLYVVWRDDTGVTAPEGENPPDEIFFTKSADGGNTWEPYQNISNNGGNSVTWSIAIAVDGLNLYVVWHDDTLGNNEIFFRRSTDGGVTWDTTVNISNDARIDTRTSIAVDGQYIYVIWDDHMDSEEIFFRRSTDYGVTWDPDLAEPAVNISNDARKSMCPVIAIDGPYLYVVIGMGRFTWSKDYGVTWEPLTTGLWGMEPSIAVDGSNLYVVWEQGLGGDIFFRRGTLDKKGTSDTTDDVVTWEEPYQNLSNNAGDSRFPSIGVEKSNIYVAWYDDTLDPGYHEIFFRRSTDGGVTWKPPTSEPAENLSNTTGVSSMPKVPQYIATFLPCPNLPVKIAGTSQYYSTLQDAYDAAVDGDTILSHSVAFTEDLYIDRDISVTLLEGGYNCDYTDNSGETGETRLNGTMTISNGTLTIGFFVLE